MAGLLRLLKGKWYPPEDPSTDLSGKVVIVTGANTGLGFEAAMKYVKLGAAKVIIGCRSLNKGKQAQKAIEDARGHVGVVDVWQLDMDTYKSVTAFAERASSELKRIDIVLLNAGVHMKNYQESPEGWEEDIQVNVLSTALLALLLLPKLKSQERDQGRDVFTPHLVIVGSGTHTHAKVDRIQNNSVLRTYSNPKGYSGFDQYPRSKLFAHHIAAELAKMALDDQGRPLVIVNVVCPGMCRSDLGRQYKSLLEQAATTVFYSMFARTTEQGSRSLVSASLLPPEHHGKWWQYDTFPPQGPLVTSEEGQRLQSQVWSEVLQELKEKVPQLPLDVSAPGQSSNAAVLK